MARMSTGSDAKRGTGLKLAARPGYLAGLAALLALTLGAFAWYELRESRARMLRSLDTGALSLAAAVARAGENAIRADTELEYLLSERLFYVGREAAVMARRGSLASIAEVATESQTRLDLFAPNGALVASSDAEGMERLEQEWWWETAQSLAREGVDEILVGEEMASQYAVAVVTDEGGMVLVRGDARPLLELRRNTGVGRLMGELGDDAGVAYLVLQDTSGILTASRGVAAMSRIADDPFLMAVATRSLPQTRITEYSGAEVLEAVQPFAVDDQHLGILRIALSLDGLRDQEDRDRLQLLLVGGLLLVIGATAVAVVTVRQNYGLLDKAFVHIQTYSSALLQQMGDAVVAMAPSGRIEVYNAAAEALFGVAGEVAMGRPHTDVLGPCEPLQEALRPGHELQAASFRIETPAGVVRTVSASSAATTDDRGSHTVVVVLQDQTERRALELDLGRQERLASMGALAAGVAHEVRNPLNAIAVIAQRLQREYEPPEGSPEYRKLTATVRDEVGRVNKIVEEFLELARPPVLTIEPLDVRKLIETAVAAVESQAAVKGIAIRTEYREEGTFEGDRGQLQQALQNLLRNAVEATADGSVSVRTRCSPGGLHIDVEDTGCGIAEEHRERIFDLYFTTKPGGTGLGLSLVQRIVSEHGGRLELESTLGEGTRVTMSFPARQTKQS